MAAEKASRFDELRRVLSDIEAKGIVEEETDEVKACSEALRAITAGDTTFDTLTHEEMDEIAASTPGVSFDQDRRQRTREHLRQQKVVGLARQTGAMGSVVPAALFRRDGSKSSEDQRRAQETLERLRRQLDEEDDPQP